MIEFLISAILITHAVVVGRWWRDFNRLEGRRSEDAEIEPLTVIVACRNEEISLPILLNHLEAQITSPVEIIIVDDHSEDQTQNVARDYAAKLLNSSVRTKITVILNNGRGKKDAIRTGIERAETNWVVTTDADVIAPPTWILSMGRAISERSGDELGVGAIIEPVKIAGGGIESIEYAAMMGWAAASSIKGSAAMGSAANLAFRVEYYPSEEDMRCDIESGDDVFAVHALVNSGKLVFWAHDIDACVSANQAGGVRKWIRQRARWGAKAKYYELNSAKRISIWIALLGITELTTLGLVIAGVVSLKVLFVLWGGRALIDIIFTSRVTKWFRIRSTIWDWLLLSIIYPFQIMILLFGKTKWR